MNPWFLLVTMLLLLANAFFVAVEFALVASRRTRLESLASEGSASARSALAALKAVSLNLAGVQLGITMASLALGAVAEPTFAHMLEAVFGAGDVLPEGVVNGLGLAIGLGIVVFLHMVLGEMIPKYIVMADPEKSMLWLAIPNRIYFALFRPFIRALNAIGNAGTRLFGVEPRDELVTAHTAAEFESMLTASREEGLIEPMAHELLTGALDFGERPVRDIVVPIDQVTTVARTATIAEVEEAVVEHGHSRLLVIGRDIDDVIGFIHAKDLLTAPPEARDRPIPVGRIRRILVLDADRPLDEVLVAMRRSRTHVGVVCDAEGHTLGLVTLEDVLEELVGDIRDESDPALRGG